MTKLTWEQYVAQMQEAAELTLNLQNELRSLAARTKDGETIRRALRLSSALGINSMHYQDSIKGSLRVLGHTVEETKERK